MGSEMHWYAEGVDVSTLAVTLAAMANSNGGIVIIGVSQKAKKILGVRSPAEIFDHAFQSMLFTEPSLVLPMPQVIRNRGKQLVFITVPPGLPNVYSVDGRYYGRSGNRDVPLSPRLLRRLLIDRGAVQFESQVPPGSSLNDLDLEKMRSYALSLDVMETVAEKGTNQERVDNDWLMVMVRRGCLQLAGDEFLPTYAGILLFGNAPQQWLPSASILAARFLDTTFSDEFIRQEIRGSLPDQLRQVEGFLRTNMRSLVRMVGLTHQEMPEYPFEAVRELLVNAVAHRDYNAQGDTIHVHMFSDRVEIHSPGGLPGPVNLENLLQARFARNAVITQVLADMGFVERLGYGLDRVVKSMREFGLPSPRFEEVARTFRVTLLNGFDQFHKNVETPDISQYNQLDLSPRQQKVVGYLLQKPRITNRAYQELCPDVHAETLRRDLADLVSKGVIIKVGDKKSTYYILKHSP
jgi:ATP-dependent DNA helicase RecG